MAYGYWKKGLVHRKAAFTLCFRRHPFKGNYAIAAGLESAIEFIQNFRFEKEGLDYLRSLRSDNGESLFEDKFLDYLKDFQFSCDLQAVPEGTPVFPYEPLVVVTGSILEAQLLESALLNIINFQTLIATKSSRICAAAEGGEVCEFGLRRAQGVDGALSGARAAYIGGCHATSNVLAGARYGIPVKGTHAHSWVMAFDEEKEAFESYADVMPQNCIYLADTYDTVRGVKKAIEVAKQKESLGVKMKGVRLDSGDLAHLSIEIRKLLDEAGFYDAKIMASNELDEFIIRDLKKQGAKIDIWGVGTNLITAKDQPALDGVYKLSAIQDEAGNWIDKVKISEQLVKTTNPGRLQVRRYENDQGEYVMDMLFDLHKNTPEELSLIDPLDPTRRQSVTTQMRHHDLLTPIFEKGKLVYESPSLDAIRSRCAHELERFSPPVRRFLHPQTYFVGLESSLYEHKMDLIEKIKAK